MITSNVAYSKKGNLTSGQKIEVKWLRSILRAQVRSTNMLWISFSKNCMNNA